MSLVPELLTAVQNKPIIAAGGITEGSGILAALALGAQAVVMGTRFTVADESAMPDKAKQMVIETSDGGANTQRYSRSRRISDLEHGSSIIFGGSTIGCTRTIPAPS
jgi:nitronate monooxygenase